LYFSINLKRHAMKTKLMYANHVQKFCTIEFNKITNVYAKLGTLTMELILNVKYVQQVIFHFINC